ncbi:hypothetical protein [Neisseria chenwenguii]|nr:hypothetical protein [Neisseria chenwenguii]
MKPLGLNELEQVAGGEAWMPAQFGFYPRRTSVVDRLAERD